ncbi:unnamed protein product, partial [Oppiella nova]
VGTNKATHTLNVSFGPILKPHNETVYGVDVNRDVRIKCEVEGNPKPDIAWLMLGQTNVLGTDGELLVKDVTEKKTGKYICRASVKGFPEISSQLIVRLNGPPQIEDPYIHYGLIGETIVNIDSNRGVNIIDERIPGESTILSTVVIYNAKLSDFGEYNCTIRNRFGFDNRVIILAEKIGFTTLVTFASLLLSILVVIVLITIVVILCLRHRHMKKAVKLKKKGSLYSSTDRTSSDTSDETLVESDVSTAGTTDDTDAGIHVEMQSITSSEMSAPAPHHSRRSHRSHRSRNTGTDIVLDYELEHIGID